MAGTEDIPEAVRRLIAERIGSVAELEVLLLVRTAPEKAWSPGEVARALVFRPDAAAGFLSRLADRGLVAAEGEGRFRFAPPPGIGRDVDGLAQCYATRRTTVIGLIFAHPPGDPGAATRAGASGVRRPA